MKKLIYLMSLFLLISSCANHSFETIPLVNSQELSFSGKGAGAGMMLMSSMGPVGIAIGVAIDEGIAKDIRAAASDVDVNIKNILRESLRQHKPLLRADDYSAISIDKFGFISWPGEGDLVMPVLYVSITDYSNTITQIKFPEDFNLDQQAAGTSSSSTSINLFTGKLDQVKADGEEIKRLFTLAADQLVSRLVNL